MRALLACMLLGAGCLPGAAEAQFPFRRDTPDFERHNVPYSGRYTFARLRFTPQQTGFGGGGGFFGGVNYQWDHDYPRADRHFSTIVRELTGIVPDSGTNIIAIDSPELFKYPVAYMAEPGWWALRDADIANLRAYLLKGGFLIFDDFAGGRQIGIFLEGLSRILPDARPVELDPSHPIFHTFFEIEPAVITEAHHPYFGVKSAFVGVFERNDPARRLLLIANVNNDIGEAWEWSDTGFIPIDLTNQAYKLGVNYLVYAMTR